MHILASSKSLRYPSVSRDCRKFQLLYTLWGISCNYNCHLDRSARSAVENAHKSLESLRRSNHVSRLICLPFQFFVLKPSQTALLESSSPCQLFQFYTNKVLQAAGYKANSSIDHDSAHEDSFPAPDKHTPGHSRPISTPFR